MASRKIDQRKLKNRQAKPASYSSCFDIYLKIATAVFNGVPIAKKSSKDKEFFFQDWCKERILETSLHVEDEGRNQYPDFRIVEKCEGYEIKGLAYPGRENNYDANSNVPTGKHNGRSIFYIFGRYPKENFEEKSFPVIDIVMCHGDFLNAQSDYVHKNKSIDGFGTYGDIKIRDRKMYIVPTPFAIADGLERLCTLILPENISDIPERFKCVGSIERVEADEMLAGYSFDLKTNQIQSTTVKNPNAGKKHKFKAYRYDFESDTRVCNVKK